MSEEYFGSVSLIYTFEYAISYLTMDYGSSLQSGYENALADRGTQVGRITLLSSIFEWLFTSDTKVTLLGLGFGSVTPSSWVHESRDILFETIGTRGAISGFGLALVESNYSAKYSKKYLTGFSASLALFSGIKGMNFPCAEKVVSSA